VVPDSCKPAQASDGQQLPYGTAQAISNALERAGKDANAKNFANSFLWCLLYEGILLALMFGLTFLLPRHIRPESMQHA
jgi:hypothetical protein